MMVHSWDPVPKHIDNFEMISPSDAFRHPGFAPPHEPPHEPPPRPDIAPFVAPLLLAYTFLLYDYFSLLIIGTIIAIYMSMRLQISQLGSIYSSLVVSLVATLAVQLIRRIVSQRDHYRKLSHTDSLTGLYSLRYTLLAGQNMLDEGGGEIILYLIDMNGFKQINDTYGHLAGNHALIHVARVLSKQMEGFDGIVGRLGGDEFVAVVRNAPEGRGLSYREKAVQAIGKMKFSVNDNLRLALSFSVGESRTKTKGTPIRELLHTADMDMYANKQSMKRAANASPELYEGLTPEQRELLLVVKEKDLPTYLHSQQTAEYATLLGEAARLPADDRKQLIVGAWLHDVGKVLVASGIWRKNSALTEEEYAAIRKHVLYGVNMVQHLSLSEIAMNCIRYHHERWDGAGYPSGAKGQDTPPEGRMMQIVDAFSAMTSHRSYRESKSMDQALAELGACAGKQFDPQLVSLFIDAVRRAKASG
jgi:diguanylate cyclase (GGDEF)-like protein/putative nucleotidyltransferase with HDIG domain